MTAIAFADVSFILRFASRCLQFCANRTDPNVLLLSRSIRTSYLSILSLLKGCMYSMTISHETRMVTQFAGLDFWKTEDDHADKESATERTDIRKSTKTSAPTPPPDEGDELMPKSSLKSAGLGFIEKEKRVKGRSMIGREEYLLGKKIPNSSDRDNADAKQSGSKRRTIRSTFTSPVAEDSASSSSSSSSSSSRSPDPLLPLLSSSSTPAPKPLHSEDSFVSLNIGRYLPSQSQILKKDREREEENLELLIFIGAVLSKEKRDLLPCSMDTSSSISSPSLPSSLGLKSGKDTVRKLGDLGSLFLLSQGEEK
jgi:hypothetical protein